MIDERVQMHSNFWFAAHVNPREGSDCADGAKKNHLHFSSS